MLDNLFRGVACGLIVAFWAIAMLLAGFFIGEYQFIAKAEYGKIAMLLLVALALTYKLINLIEKVWTTPA